MVKLSDPVNVSMTPGGVTLGQLQTNQFSARVDGSADQSVTWKLNLPVGSISRSGLYTAPSRITMVQVLTVTATSVSDPLKSARALITLMTPVNISASPAYALADGKPIAPVHVHGGRKPEQGCDVERKPCSWQRLGVGSLYGSGNDCREAGSDRDGDQRGGLF